MVNRYKLGLRRVLMGIFIVSRLLGVRMKTLGAVCFISLSLLLGILPLTSWGHSGENPIRFVSESGVDEGVCNNPSFPCRSIPYAVNQAVKGDKIHVAQGVYPLQGLDIIYLLSDMVEIKGGFSKDFRTFDQAKFRASISGVSVDYREKLAQRGFDLIRDRKGLDIAQNVKDKQLIETYQKITNSIEGPLECIDGLAGAYTCHNIDMLSHIPLNQLSSTPTSASDIWGFVDLNNQREYALMGLQNGTVVIDVTDPEQPLEVGTIFGRGSTWRDVKVYQYFDQADSRYKAYAYVTTEARAQGLQVLDLTDLPNQVTLAATVDAFSTAHNVYVSNVDYSNSTALPGHTAYLYIEGADLSNGAFRVYNLNDPVTPELQARPPNGTGYVHDATSLIITDSRTSDCQNGHNPCELFVDFNENTVDIWDVTDLAQPTMLSSTGYSGASFTHSGWWSEDKMTLFIQDELDEQERGLNTTLRALDISDLLNPTIVGTYTGQTQAIDHNGFTLGNYYYMSNYRRGLSVIDVSDPSNMKDVALFDTFAVPANDLADFNGAWGVYPYLPSGSIIVSDTSYGLFVLKLNENDGNFPSSNNSGGNNASGDNSGGGGGSFGWSLSCFTLLLVSRRKKLRC